jgi:uncharacterized protein (UPF0276 family)
MRAMTTGEISHRCLSARAGVGLRSPHIAEVMRTHPAVPWFEVHAENYMGGGPAVRALTQIRRDYPISLHGVGLSLGSADGLDARHLARLKRLVERLEPVLVSEHLAWSMAGGAYLNHLLPLVYSEETLAIVCRNVDHAQTVLGRRLLVENPASYLRFVDSCIPEPEFLTAIVRRTGCALLCDVNNIYVTSQNFAQNPVAYLEMLPTDVVGEMHLAGHAVNDADGQPIWIDDHGAPVSQAVWTLFTLALARFGPVPTLLEWDTNIPEFAVLVAEASKADDLLATAQRGSTDADVE